MSELKGKIDFVAFISVSNANPNGDPLTGNRPRKNYDGYGEISDVCIKRKIRNRFQDLGERVFVQSDDRKDDSFKSLRERADGCAPLKAEFAKGKKADKDACAAIACREWVDVRTFGQVFAFKGSDVSLGVRGPVTIHQAKSVFPVNITDMQITKSVNSEPGKDSKASDTMGVKHYVEFGLYKIKGSVNVQLAQKTGFSQEDAELLKQALKTLFENDASSARPEGSMDVVKLFWWQHNEKTPSVSTARIHGSVEAVIKDPEDFKKKKSTQLSANDYEIVYKPLDCVEPEIYPG